MENLTTDQAVNNIDMAIRQINTSRDNHTILSQSLMFLKKEIDDLRAALQTCQENK